MRPTPAVVVERGVRHARGGPRSLCSVAAGSCPGPPGGIRLRVALAAVVLVVTGVGVSGCLPGSAATLTGQGTNTPTFALISVRTVACNDPGAPPPPQPAPAVQHYSCHTRIPPNP